MIVGMGLAGACLALQLMKLKKKLLVFDMPTQNRASSVAAGLFNPITGRKVVKTWRTDEIFPYLHTFYEAAEKTLASRFFYKSPIYTPFVTVEEQNDWVGKSADQAWSGYLLKVATRSVYGDQVHDPLGGILIDKGGYIDTNTFLEAVRSLLKRDDAYREEVWQEDEVSVAEGDVFYRGVVASKLVFCSGIHLSGSRFFTVLPLVPLKGETITITTTRPLDRIYNRGIYFVPVVSGEGYKVGATYQIENIRAQPTAEGKEQLVQKAKAILRNPFVCTHQDWGIRPSTTDRRPLLGSHPQHKHIFVFNGLGTKGVSLAPYFSNALVKYMEGDGNLDKEANICRIKPLSSKF